MWLNSKSWQIAEDGAHTYVRSGAISRHDVPSAALPLMTLSGHPEGPIFRRLSGRASMCTS